MNQIKSQLHARNLQGSAERDLLSSGGTKQRKRRSARKICPAGTEPFSIPKAGNSDGLLLYPNFENLPKDDQNPCKFLCFPQWPK